MKDLEIPSRYLPVQFERSYHRIDKQTLRAENRNEDRHFIATIIPKLRNNGFPVYPSTYIPRAQISSTELGIAEAILLLECDGFHEQNTQEHEIYPCTGGAMESDFSE